ncbi:MAG: hypothetical protein M1434_09285 [Chloroflexi bacterium]|nr:hypothetical protein [Chloroflexota bacterium]MCL5274917.1 hypothetical protein [Chloroflexota bacterium]
MAHLYHHWRTPAVPVSAPAARDSQSRARPHGAGSPAGPHSSSPTPIVAQTPMPRVGFDAPQLLSPLDGATISQTEEVVTLQWLSVGLLKDNEWYVVQIQPSGAITVPIFETKATSIKITRAILRVVGAGETVPRRGCDHRRAQLYRAQPAQRSAALHLEPAGGDAVASGIRRERLGIGD